MKKLVGLLAAVALLGLASPAVACGNNGCNCDKKAKEAGCDHKKDKAEDEKAARGCGHTGDTTADSDASDVEATAQAELSIDGMSCGNCAGHLASTLEGVEGVVEADVSLEDETATVKFDREQIDTDALIEAVQNTHNGKFSAELVSESSVKS